jgi:peptidoglycan/LPS O-acetylase OafA/YrhL
MFGTDARTSVASSTEPPRRLQGIDTLRGIAASCIVIHHLAHLSLTEASLLVTFARMYLGLGVPLFFIISAFALMTRYGDTSWTLRSVSEFWLRRIFRIYPIYLVMLTFTVFFLSGFANTNLLDRFCIPAFYLASSQI